jgi:AcrR family transcriptional regulator
MAEKKRPRRTRERILETSLVLFNRFGEPHITTADIADEMNISPGNLYYHFRNKDEIIGDLYGRFEAGVAPLFTAPEGRRPDVEDLWLLLHLLFERMWEYRFLFRDLDELTSRNRRIASRFASLVRQGEGTVLELFRGMVAAGTMHANARELAACARNVVIVATYWMSFERISRVASPAAANEAAGHFERAAYQVLALIAPFLIGDARALIEGLGERYVQGT